jgi:hypothetical protein
LRVRLEDELEAALAEAVARLQKILTSPGTSIMPGLVDRVGEDVPQLAARLGLK